MRWKKVVAMGTMVTMLGSVLAGCGSTTTNSTDTTGSDTSSVTSTEESDSTASADTSSEDEAPKYADIEVGTTYKDVTATIKFLNNRTDMLMDDYNGTPWSTYISQFNELYPNVTVEIEGLTNYAEESLLRLQGGQWGDIMMIPQVDKFDLGTYFLSYGDLETMNGEINYAVDKSYDDQVFGVPSFANGQGIVYNKKVFEEAGITELPKTPEEFIAALTAINEKTDAIPLYTNYAAEWTMGSWDAYLGGSATGQGTYMNQILLHASNPFADPGDGTHAYNVYKVLFDAVEKGLTEDDYSTTDWEGCKGMINNGQIATMVLGSWAVGQMQTAGDNGADIGYMPFPITVDGKQYASAGPDYGYGINVNSSVENQQAAMCFVKFMTEKSAFIYDQGGLPVAKDDTRLPELYSAFEGVEIVSDEPAVDGEVDLLNILNSESELMINAGGNQKVMAIVEHASNGDMTFDEIMDEWNAAWTAAQEAEGVEITK